MKIGSIVFRAFHRWLKLRVMPPVPLADGVTIPGLAFALREYAMAEPVQDRGQIDKATRHGDVSNIHGPGLIGPSYCQAAQQERINPVSWRGLGSVRFAIEGHNRHPPYQRAHVAADFQTLLVEHVAQNATVDERVVQLQLFDARIRN